MSDQYHDAPAVVTREGRSVVAQVDFNIKIRLDPDAAIRFGEAMAELGRQIKQEG